MYQLKIWRYDTFNKQNYDKFNATIKSTDIIYCRTVQCYIIVTDKISKKFNAMVKSTDIILKKSMLQYHESWDIL